MRPKPPPTLSLCARIAHAEGCANLASPAVPPVGQFARYAAKQGRTLEDMEVGVPQRAAHVPRTSCPGPRDHVSPCCAVWCALVCVRVCVACTE